MRVTALASNPSAAQECTMTAITAQGRKVERHTPSRVQRAIDDRLQRSLQFYARYPSFIDARLEQIGREWDIERTLEANAATLSFASILASVVTGKKIYLFAGAVTGFLLQHSLQGWCPPLPFFRSCGVRSKDEIMLEYLGLRLLRDGLEKFDGMSKAEPAEQAALVWEVLCEPAPAESD
jgi:hypothetical protein